MRQISCKDFSRIKIRKITHTFNTTHRYLDSVLCGGRVSQQTIGTPMGTNCSLLLADLFQHAYEADFLQMFLKNEDRQLAQTINFSFR